LVTSRIIDQLILISMPVLVVRIQYPYHPVWLLKRLNLIRR
jgi:hypothetical protein